MLQIKKRNGVLAPFDKDRIGNAIRKAVIEVDGVLGDIDNSIAENIAQEIKDRVAEAKKVIGVEEIQDWCEDSLMASNRRDVAKAYVRYRYKREMVRKGGDNFILEFSKKVNGTNVENSNANLDEFSFGGRIGSASDYQMKQYALDYCVSDMARKNHLNNEIYIHDLAQYAVGSHNCLTIPFDKLLANGFNTRQTDVRPANSINTAFQLVAVIFQLQSLMQFGGVSASHLDWTMVPYVRKSFYKHYRDGLNYIEDSVIEFELSKDEIVNISITNKDIYSYPKAYKYAMDMTEKELYQAVEGMYHNLNTLQSRSGN